MKAIFFVILISGLFYCCSQPSNESSSPNARLIGTWKWNALVHEDSDTVYAWNEVYGQIIFTEKYYNLIYVYNNGLREKTRTVPFDSLSHEELRNSIGKVTSNAGQYHIEGDSIVFLRDVALWPNAMTGENQRSTIPMPVKISQDTLYWDSEGFKNAWVRRK